MGRACQFICVTACLLCAGAQAQQLESLRIRITNTVGGAIEISSDGGKSWCLQGRVTVPAGTVNRSSYTAAGWAQDGHIAATAVNAIHIKVASNPETGRPMTVSIVPGGEVVGAATRQRSSSIFTNIPGGCGIFGGGLGPYVNNQVLLQREGAPAPLPPDYTPHENDVLIIVRTEPLRLPHYAIFENRVGGQVSLDYGNGLEPVGLVDRPVSGIGRFEGSMYAWPGRIRANHPGVIDVSTAPRGTIGGFQIIPRAHAQSPELAYVLAGHQWMIIGPFSDGDWAGVPPFFSGSILPSYRPDDILGDHDNWAERVLSRAMVQVRFDDGPWELMPRIGFSADPSRGSRGAESRGRRGDWLICADPRGGPLPLAQRDLADHALDGVTHVRIAFPQMTFPPSRSPGFDAGEMSQ